MFAKKKKKKKLIEIKDIKSALLIFIYWGKKCKIMMKILKVNNLVYRLKFLVTGNKPFILSQS